VALAVGGGGCTALCAVSMRGRASVGSHIATCTLGYAGACPSHARMPCMESTVMAPLALALQLGLPKAAPGGLSALARSRSSWRRVRIPLQNGSVWLTRLTRRIGDRHQLDPVNMCNVFYGS